MGHLGAFFEAYYMIYGLAVMNYRSLPSRVQCSSGQHSFWHLIHQQGNCEGELHRFQLRIRPLAISQLCAIDESRWNLEDSVC